MATTTQTINLPYPTSVTGTSGSTLSYVNGTVNWSQSPQNFVSNNGQPIMTIPYGESKVVLENKAALEVKGKVIINGENLEDRLERIETLLQIPTRDVIMESKYPKLKKLWEEYNRELAKYKTWDALKGSENDGKET